MGKKRKLEVNTRKSRVWNKTEGHCHLCGERFAFEDKWEVDHLVPRAKGGVDEEWNLLPICRFCNIMKKAARTYQMRRVLMYGRYCLDLATKRATSVDGARIFELVGRRVKSVASNAKAKPLHMQLWRHTPKK